MELNMDDIVIWEYDLIKINLTLLNTWILMIVLLATAVITRRKIKLWPGSGTMQSMAESLMDFVGTQIRRETNLEAKVFLPFIATLFIFIAGSNVLSIIPLYDSPAGSMSTASALAMSVFMAVPIFGIRILGWRKYFSKYLRPTPLMLPFNIIGEFSRTLALAIRLFGNVMSGSLIVAILLSISPFLFPVAMQAFGLLIGVIQAYVFSLLALVYIVSAVSVTHRDDQQPDPTINQQEKTNG